MVEIPISLNSISTVQQFVEGISHIDCDLDIVSSHRRYTVDAKSIMGIFSLDLSRPVILIVHSNDEKILEEVTKVVERIGRENK